MFLTTPLIAITALVSSLAVAAPAPEPASTAAKCKNPATILANGNFETGALAPWQLLTVIPPLDEYTAQYLQLGVDKPGYKSAYKFSVNDTLASSYVEVDIGQNVTLCQGQKYKLSAEFYMTDAHDGPQTYVELWIDDTRVAVSKASDAKGPPVVWTPLSGEFTASAKSQQVRVRFVATDYLGVQWAVDNVVVKPA
ncbi:MAG: hypothetical protein LQ351_004063 [Letrouitia transgressa]|nr:MAG: hypothetical protein LQ351_004063 [Letrouitia transgressa]